MRGNKGRRQVQGNANLVIGDNDGFCGRFIVEDIQQMRNCFAEGPCFAVNFWMAKVEAILSCTLIIC